MSIDLTSGIVQILSRDNDIVGTGFLVSESGLIVTCAHVVQSAEAGPGDKLTVCFHKTGERSDALVVQKWWRSPDNEDVAILKLEGQIPEGVKSLPLGSSEGIEGHELKTFGFPNLGSINGLWGEGTLYGKVTERGNTLLQIHSTKEISLGFSGAPLYDKSRNRVIGIIVSIVIKDPFDKLQDIVFAVPSEILRLTCSELEIKDICPYRGLSSFTEEDQRFFFGREKLVQELIDKLRSNPRFLGVTGSSGRGKSSVVSAGLLPRIRSGDIPGLESAQIVTFRPGIKPNESLENALDSVLHIGKSDFFWDGVLSCLQNECNKSLVIFVDQFEELFTIPEENERSQFIENLNNLLKSQLKVSLILTIRADFIEFLTDSKFEKYFNQGNVSVKRMSDDEFKEAITNPAKAVGLDIQAELEKSLIEDLESTEDPLPLLEFTLTKLWEHQSDGQLTYESYRDLGGVAGAIGQWAGKVYDKLSDEEKELSKRIFTRLIHYGENGTKDSRRRLSLAELTAEGKDKETIHKLITKLADARLLVTDRKSLTGPETVEIIHDSLIFNWRQLREWISEDQSFLLWRQRLDIKIEEWRVGKESILKDEALVEAKKWSKERKQELNHDEKEYIQVSLKSKEREDRDLKEKEEQERKREQEFREKELLAKNRRKKEIIKGLSVFSIFTLLLAGLAVHQWYLADEQKKETLALYLASKSETLQQHYENLDTSILLAIESFRICRTTDADRLIHEALSLRYFTASMEHDDEVYNAVFSPDGEYILTASSDDTARIWNASTGEEIFRMEHNGINSAVFSPDGEYIVTAGSDYTARIWDVSTGEEAFRMEHDYIVHSAVFSPDGKYIATASWDNTSRVYDAITGEEVFRIKHDDGVNSVVFSPDGKYIATASWDNTARVYDVTTGEEVFRVKHDDVVNSVVFSPDGKYIATASWNDNTARLWSASTGEEIFRMEHDGGVNSAVFSPYGEYIATASSDNTARVWDVSTGEEIFRTKHDDEVYNVVFSPYGEYIITASEDNTARVWDVSTGEEIFRVKHDGNINSAVFSPNGEYIATASSDNTARVWNTTIEEQVCTMEHDDVVYDVIFSPDGKYIATQSEDGTARLWNASTGEEIFRMGYEDFVNSVAFSPDGEYIVTASYDNIVRLWSASTGKEIFRMEHEDSVNSVAFSPDGEYIVTASYDNIVRLWSASTGKEIFRMEHNDSVQDAIFSPNGKYIVTRDWINGMVMIWDATKGKEVFSIKHDRVYDIVFSPDGKYIATCGDNTAKVWDASTGEEICFMEHNRHVNTVAFSPDGKYVASGSDDGEAIVWSAGTGIEICFMKQDSPVYYIAFSPDGKYIATQSEDGTAGLWDVPTGEKIFNMKHNGRVNSVAFSPDGKHVATASDDSTAKIWIYQTEDIISKLSTTLTRNLTPEEWEKYMGEEPYHKTFPNLP